MTIEQAIAILKSSSANSEAIEIVESALNDYQTVLDWLINESNYYDEFLKWVQ